MKKRTNKAQTTAPKRNPAWFEEKVAELKAELEKLPADRQRQLVNYLEPKKDN